MRLGRPLCTLLNRRLNTVGLITRPNFSQCSCWRTKCSGTLRWVGWSSVTDVSWHCSINEIFVTTYQPTWRNIPEDLNLHDSNLECLSYVQFLKNNAAECGLLLGTIWYYALRRNLQHTGLTLLYSSCLFLWTLLRLRLARGRPIQGYFKPSTPNRSTYTRICTHRRASKCIWLPFSSLHFSTTCFAVSVAIPPRTILV
jgi:hypothetical protein